MGWDLLKCWPGPIAGGLSALLTLGLLKLGVWQAPEYLAQTQLFRWRGATAWNDQVVAIGIDETSLSEIGQFPWSRQYYTELLEVLIPAEPSVVVLDIVLADASAEDEALAEAMRALGRVVLAQGWDADGNLVAANPTLAEAALAAGHIHKPKDFDGLTRQVEPTVKGIPALGFAAATVHALVRDPWLKVPDTDSPLWINWPAPVSQIPTHSYAAVLEGELPAQALKDKIVLVGATAPGLDNNLATPYDRAPPASGLYLHAAVIGNILQQNFLQVLGWRWQGVILVLGGPVLGWALGRCRGRVQLVCGGAIAGSWILVSLGLFHSSYWLPVVWPIGLVGFTLAGLRMEARLREGQQLRHKFDELQHVYAAFKVGDRDRSTRSHSPTQSLLQITASLTEAADRVFHLVWRDELTQVGNRRYFDRTLAQEWQRAIRQREEIALLMCDVDFFKGFNDTYGHPAGDRCLQQVAAAIQSAVARSGDLVARYGGEEFAVVLPHTGAEGAIHIAHKMRRAVRALSIDHAASQVGDSVTISVGVAVEQPQPGSSPQALIATADSALYAAKESGRNRVNAAGAAAVSALAVPSAQNAPPRSSNR